MYQECTFKEGVAFSDYYVSTSEICNKFHKGPKNMKQFGFDANSIFLPTKIYRKLFPRVSKSLASPTRQSTLERSL